MMRFRFLYILGAFLILTSGSCSKPNDKKEGDDNTPVTPVTPPEPEGFKRYQKDLVLNSKILREYVKYSVYLPEDYETATDTRYSVVYMLHGLGDNHNSWNGNYLHANARIQDLEARGLSKMIYVYPQGFSSYYCNFYDGSYNYMDMFVNEFIPLIDQKYRTIADKQHRAVTGYSMGGCASLYAGILYKDEIHNIGGISPSYLTYTGDGRGWIRKKEDLVFSNSSGCFSARAQAPKPPME